MSKDIHIRSIDKRTLDRKIEKGAISKADYETYLNDLPDLQDQADNIADKIYGTQGDGDGSEPEQEA